MVTQGVVSRTVRDSAGPARRDHRARPGGRLPARPAAATPFAEAVSRPPARCGSALVGVGHQRRTRDPEAVAAVEDAAAAARRARPRGRGGRAAVRRRGAGPRLPHHLVRPALRPGRRREAALGGSGDSHFEADTLALAELGRAAGARPLPALRTSTATSARSPASTRPTTCSSPRRWQAAARRRRPRRSPRRCSGARRRAPPPGPEAARGSRDARPDHQREPRLGALHPARQPDRTPGDQRAAALDRRGLPLGVQFVGRLGADGLLLQLAAQLEEAAAVVPPLRRSWTRP